MVRRERRKGKWKGKGKKGRGRGKGRGREQERNYISTPQLNIYPFVWKRSEEGKGDASLAWRRCPRVHPSWLVMPLTGRGEEESIQDVFPFSAQPPSCSVSQWIPSLLSRCSSFLLAAGKTWVTDLVVVVEEREFLGCCFQAAR